MTRFRLWTLIGDPDTGKSLSVKTLASRLKGGPPGFCEILLRGGGTLNVFAKVMAWQENNKTPHQSVSEIKRKAAILQKGLPAGQPTSINILSTLRFDSHNTCPDGAHYLARWISEGWTLESLVLMSPDIHGRHDFYGKFGAPTLWHFESAKLPVGTMAGMIRNHFGWA